MAASFHDDRGSIMDLLVEPLDSVTFIRTVRGAVRGNHVHMETMQFTYVLSGRLRVVTPAGERVLGQGQSWRDEPGTPHAWEALEDTQVLVFTRGPRSGEGYEDDTERLKVPLIP